MSHKRSTALEGKPDVYIQLSRFFTIMYVDPICLLAAQVVYIIRGLIGSTVLCCWAWKLILCILQVQPGRQENIQNDRTLLTVMNKSSTQSSQIIENIEIW